MVSTALLLTWGGQTVLEEWTECSSSSNLISSRSDCDGSPLKWDINGSWIDKELVYMSNVKEKNNICNTMRVQTVAI